MLKFILKTVVGTVVVILTLAVAFTAFALSTSDGRNALDCEILEGGTYFATYDTCMTSTEEIIYVNN